MASGYLVVAEADLATMGDIADGLGLSIIPAHVVTDQDAVSAALAGAGGHVGAVLSDAAARDARFAGLLASMSRRKNAVQLILMDPGAPAGFGFLPGAWRSISIEEARRRAFPHEPILPAPAGAATSPYAEIDAVLYAPARLRRGEAERLRLIVHQRQDFRAAVQGKGAVSAPALPNAVLGLTFSADGGACNATHAHKHWSGAPLAFDFTLSAAEDAARMRLTIAVAIDDAQIGTIGLTCAIASPGKEQRAAVRARLKRHKRVFICAAPDDEAHALELGAAYERAAIATSWAHAGAGQKPLSPGAWRGRLKRSDLVHVLWSPAAANAAELEAQAAAALALRTRRGRPDIVVAKAPDAPEFPTSLAGLAAKA